MSYLICLYVYYHGNNLHRFGFVRGAVPTEEERNKGMNYGEILDMLSETDRAYFQDAGFSNYEEIGSGINIKSQIENRGIVGRDELRRDADIPEDRTFDVMGRMTPYQRKVYEEMRQAERESEYFDKTHGLTRAYEMMDDDIEDGYEEYVDLSFFDELND